MEARPSSLASRAFLDRLIRFYAPRKFTAASTPFDMGYEQCKRDLRNLVHSLIPDMAELETLEAPPEKQAEALRKEAKAASRYWWRR